MQFNSSQIRLTRLQYGNMLELELSIWIVALSNSIGELYNSITELSYCIRDLELLNLFKD